MRTFGKATLNRTDHAWWLTLEPHVMLRLKRVFEKVRKTSLVTANLTDTPENCHDLKWFMQRYPLEIDAGDVEALDSGAKAYRNRAARLDAILALNYKAQHRPTALPLRDYQLRAVDLYLANGFLLLGDDVGLGKTAVAIGSLSPATLPALVVTLTHLTRQWQEEIAKFRPDLHTHIAKKGTPYELPTWFGADPDVLIMNYHKLAGWAPFLGGKLKSLIFDEIQELRRSGSNKYFAARCLADTAARKIGLSATPIYNYGSEFHTVVRILNPDVLGTSVEFEREWCGWKGRVTDPKAFGTYVREQHIMLRRTRAEVGRELPPLTRVRQWVDSDSRELLKAQDSATELARIILSSTHSKADRFTAAGRFDMVMRQATGLAKAPFVAEFVRLLVESQERVVLFGWHRAVYEIWNERLSDLKPVMYTGTETTTQKDAAKLRFVGGESPILIMSLRSGGGLDGLQDCGCRTVVFGELDWSPGVHTQCMGRVHRDGQASSVTAYFMTADDGADPFIADTLGLKRAQAEGIVNPDAPAMEKLGRTKGDIKRLAESYLNAAQGRKAAP